MFPFGGWSWSRCLKLRCKCKEGSLRMQCVCFYGRCSYDGRAHRGSSRRECEEREESSYDERRTGLL